MATPEDFIAGLLAGAGETHAEAMHHARTYLADHAVPPTPLDASAVRFNEFGIPIVAAAAPVGGVTMPASTPATPAQAEAIAASSGGLAEAQEVQAYNLTPEEAAALVNYRAAGVSGAAGHDLYKQHARDAFGNPYIDTSDYARLHGFGLLSL